MIQFKNIEISKDEVLRYLGHKMQKIDNDLDNLINETIEESKELIFPKYVLGEYKTILGDDKVELEGTNLVLLGKDIKEHLLNANTTVIMAVTLGSIIEKKIALYEKSNLTKALILDSCATTAVEEVCDIIEEYVKEEAKNKGLGITFRYSPGYGDLPLSTQKEFIKTLSADIRIGLTTSEHYLLFPRKSVTAIIGIGNKEVKSKERDCSKCIMYNSCNFKKGGKSCGYKGIK